jgi:hypothetical protein
LVKEDIIGANCKIKQKVLVVITIRTISSIKENNSMGAKDRIRETTMKVKEIITQTISMMEEEITMTEKILEIEINRNKTACGTMISLVRKNLSLEEL